MKSSLRVTVVVENAVESPSLLAEHGLAYWIECSGGRVLFDTGQGGVLVGNAYRLSIPLREADAVVLSHGHYDHTGGLAEVLRQNRPASVYLHPDATAAKYARGKQAAVREIGMPFPSHQALQRHSGRLVYTKAPTTVVRQLTVTGEVPRQNDVEDVGGPFFVDHACTKPDPMTDDQSLFFETRRGTVVLLGCAHSGVVNTLNYVSELTSGQPIHAVVGGMHLVNASAERIDWTIDQLRRWNLNWLAPGHCTGRRAVAALCAAFGKRCVACHVGSTFGFD